MEQPDHDILIEIKTTINFLVINQAKYFSELKELTQQLARLDTLRGVAETKLENLDEDLHLLQKKSVLYDGLNALAIAISTALGFLFGHR